MSIASPKLSPVILATNHNGHNQTNSSSTTSLKKELNNNNSSRISNGNNSINHKNESISNSPSKRKIPLLHTSDESDDDKPLVMISKRFFNRVSFFSSSPRPKKLPL